MTTSNIISIEKKGEKLSKLQTQFNSYTKKIDDLKNFITTSKTNLDFGRNLFNEKIEPVYAKMRQIDVDIVYTLDSHFDDPKASKNFKKNISYYIVEQTPTLISVTENSDKLEEIYQKHNGISYEDEVNEQRKEQEDMIKKMFGVDMNDEEQRADFFNKTTPEDFLNGFLGGKQDKKSTKNANHEERQAKKKTAGQIAKELKAEEEAKNVGQASRKIYTELVKQFHPDREPDEQERERKTEIMKRITAAYEKNDLFDLLKLQLEYLQIDNNHINKLADDKLKYYNKILKEQLDELQDELAEVTGDRNPFEQSFFEQYCRGTQADIIKRIEKRRKDTNKVFKQMQDKLSFMYDAIAASYYLKDFKAISQREAKMSKGMFGFGF